MDNVTHTLFALTLARTKIGGAGRGTTAALVIASNAPDIDIVAAAGGAVSYLEWHRGPTHGPIGIVALSLVTAGLVWSGLRWLDTWTGRTGDDRGNASGGMLAVVSIIGVFLHVAMDVPTSYGTRLLSPLTWDWFAADWMPIVDIYLLTLLTAGLVFGADPHGRRRNAAIVLALVTANYGVRAAAHHLAVAAVPRVFGRALPPPCEDANSGRAIDAWPGLAEVPARHATTDRCAREVAAIPTFVSPFRWRLVVHLSTTYLVQEIDLLDRRFRSPGSEARPLWPSTGRHASEWTPEMERAAQTRVGQVFLGFSRFPAARASIDTNGVTTVRWTDMRFMDGPPRGGSSDVRGGLFTAVVRIGPDGRVLEQRLGG